MTRPKASVGSSSLPEVLWSDQSGADQSLLLPPGSCQIHSYVSFPQYLWHNQLSPLGRKPNNFWIVRLTCCPWLIPAGKLVSTHHGVALCTVCTNVQCAETNFPRVSNLPSRQHWYSSYWDVSDSNTATSSRNRAIRFPCKGMEIWPRRSEFHARNAWKSDKVHGIPTDKEKQQFLNFHTLPRNQF